MTVLGEGQWHTRTSQPPGRVRQRWKLSLERWAGVGGQPARDPAYHTKDRGLADKGYRYRPRKDMILSQRLATGARIYRTITLS